MQGREDLRQQHDADHRRHHEDDGAEGEGHRDEDEVGVAARLRLAIDDVERLEQRLRALVGAPQRGGETDGDAEGEPAWSVLDERVQLAVKKAQRGGGQDALQRIDEALDGGGIGDEAVDGDGGGQRRKGREQRVEGDGGALLHQPVPSHQHDHALDHVEPAARRYFVRRRGVAAVIRTGDPVRDAAQRADRRALAQAVRSGEEQGGHDETAHANSCRRPPERERPHRR